MNIPVGYPDRTGRPATVAKKWLSPMKRRLRTKFSRAFCLTISFCALLAILAGSFTAGAEKPVGTAGPQLPLPGIEEVAPKATDLAARAADAEQQIAQVVTPATLQPEVDALETTLAELESKYQGWKESDDWPLSQFMDARSHYTLLQREQAKLQEQFTTPLKALERLRQDWLIEQDFWIRWQAALKEMWETAEKEMRIKAPRDAFRRTRKMIQGVLAHATDATNLLIKLQQDFSAQQEQVAGRISHIDGAIDNLRRASFRRNALSPLSPAFYRQFSDQLTIEFRSNLSAVLYLPDGFLRTQGWIALLQLVACGAIGLALSLRRRRPEPLINELKFLFKSPWAGGIFLAITLFSWLYNDPPPLWRWGLIVAGVTTATILIAGIYKRSITRRVIRLLAAVILISETLTLIGIPRPIEQVYLLLLCLATIAICTLMARHQQALRDQANYGLVMILYIMSLMGIIGLVSGLSGYATFTTNMIDIVLRSIIVILATDMAIRLTDGTIYALMHKDWVCSQRFVHRLGTETTARLQTLLRVCLIANATVYMFVAWNVYNSQPEALAALLAWEIEIGELNVSMRALVFLSLVLYLTNLISWLLQALLDAQLMTPRKMELGVKTAIKRLVHYALFTIGFLVAISMAGLDLQKLTIIAGALGVGIGFGLQNIVNNFVSGLILLFERPVKVGDTINIDDQWGTITKIGLRATVFETFDHAEIIVPNSDLIAHKVTNWTFTSNISRILLPVGVAYGSDLAQVLEILTQAGHEHPEILDDPPVSAIFTCFGDSSIDFELRVWITDINLRLKIKSELGQAIDRGFREAGITIPFPQRDLHLCSIESNLQSLLGNSSTKQPSEHQGPIA